ncbi:MAG: hypothetical protein GF418_08960, partial [Chitinivibrionales bacterium]|nr:hypothetical protein [Chitinivibrionales bacterium]MBD3395743.1 hypothetical protein [Chitinivibrionales bacterium]
MKSPFISRIFLPLFLATTACFAASFGPYADASYSTGISSKSYSTAAFGDYNNDGFIDLAMTDCDGGGACNLGNLHLYTNNPLNPGRFSHQIVLSSSTGPARQLAWGDFDNDGDLDLYANGGGSLGHQYLLQNQGESGGFALQLVGGGSHSDNVLPGNDNVQGAGWLDANQDGWLDLFVSNGNGGSSKMYLNKGEQSLSDPNWFNASNATNWFTKYEQSSWASGEASRNGSYSTFGDFDNDTRQDIFYAVDEEGTRRVFVWHNQTTKESSTFDFEEKGQTVLDPPTAGTSNRISWTGIVTWDPDNDGDMDLTVGWANHLDNFTHTPQFYENRGGYGPIASLTGILDDRSMPWTQHATYTGGVAFADAYNNGLLDLYMAHSNASGDESHKFYKNNGSLNFDEIETGISHSNWAAGATFGDVDNDGDADLFLCNGGRLLINNTNSRNVPADSLNKYYDTHGFYPPQGTNAEHYLDV